MGRPKSSPDRERSTKLTVRTRPAWLAWLASLATRAKDRDVAAMIERLAEEEARRLGHDPSPGR